MNEMLAPNSKKPHVVILGAGASRAACTNGDRQGRVLPLMNDLVHILDLEPLIRRYGIEARETNFEAIYSEIATRPDYREVVDQVENAVFDYFRKLALPDEPTLYDHLVLSLRPKDTIATFNWDPLLWQALQRACLRFGPHILPTPLFLHGNVAVGYCSKHDKLTLAPRNGSCRKCGSPLEASRLLYPIAKKNYASDSIISFAWERLKVELQNAFLVTIFGYGAPESDAEAIRLMRQAWGDGDSRDLEEVEIINTLSEDELVESWHPFICRDHYFVENSFYQSLAAQHPRRSCEDFWEAIMQINPQIERPIPRDASWRELESWIEPLLEQEAQHR